MLFANIIGRNFKDSDYVHVGDDSGEKYVTLKRFGKLFLTAVPYVARSHWCAVLTQTRNILDRMESHETQAKPLPVVAFSISLLLDYIRFGQGWWSWNEWDVHDGLWKNRRVPRNRCLVRHQPLTDHMTGPAWCPFNNRRYDSYGTAVFFHLTKLERRTFPLSLWTTRKIAQQKDARQITQISIIILYATGRKLFNAASISQDVSGLGAFATLSPLLRAT